MSVKFIASSTILNSLIPIIFIQMTRVAFADDPRCSTGDYACYDATIHFGHTRVGLSHYPHTSPNAACASFNVQGYSNGRVAFRPDLGTSCEYTVTSPWTGEVTENWFGQGWLIHFSTCTGSGGQGQVVFTAPITRTIEGVPIRTSQCGYCPSGTKYVGNGICVPQRCAVGQHFNEATNQCESPCPHDKDPLGECNPPPEEKNCGAESNNPIDFASGEKLRREHIITAGAKYPITLTYFYNNHNNHEKTAAGIVANHHIKHQVISTATPISTTEYSANYNDKGLLKSASLADQYYGNIEQYWRHSFDDVLQIRGDYYQLHLANGQTKTFQGLGTSASHKDEALVMLTAGEEDFAGFKWVNYKTGKEKRFDSTGRLRKVINRPFQITTLAYDTNGQLETISNNYGDSLTLAYTSKAADSIYAHSSNQTQYPTSITASNGQQVDLDWDHNFRGQTQTFHLLTRITEPYTTETSETAPTTARGFAYGDSRWPASLTQIDTVKNIATNEKATYATFQYDDQGRAIYSSLAGGADATTVNYVDELTRTVTNALGKDATYTFAMVDGVKRLKKVVGEPTTNCLQSEVEYIYNSNGSVFEKHQNGKVTRFTQYDNKGRELERIEAFGTPDARAIKTEWHPTLNVKTKVIEPKTTTEWEYFDDGKLKATNTYATAN